MLSTVRQRILARAEMSVVAHELEDHILDRHGGGRMPVALRVTCPSLDPLSTAIQVPKNPQSCGFRAQCSGTRAQLSVLIGSRPAGGAARRTVM